MGPARSRSPAALPRIVLVTPSLQSANDGNWQTARRWARFLEGTARLAVATHWDGSACDGMIALHARRSAEAIRAFTDTGRPSALVLTGTDLYRDIDSDADAQRSLELARLLVVLQAEGLTRLAEPARAKARVIHQSAPRLTRKTPRISTWDMVLVGHLRDEKDPLTAARAMSRLHAPQLRLLQIGGAKDARVGAAFAQAADRDARIVRLGPLPHAATRQWISRSRLMLLPSIMEGGANVLIEAVTSGVPVLASRISGSIGMLGPDYAGYFTVGDDAALAALVERCRDEPEFLRRLTQACAARAPLFEPRREQAAVRQLVSDLLRPGA